MVANNNIFYSVKTSAMAFTPFNFISSSLYNIFRFTNNSYLNGNLAGTNTVTYPTVNGTNVLASESFTDVNYTSTFNNANMYLTNLPSSADTNLVTFNTSTKKIGYAAIPSAPSTLLASNNAWTGKKLMSISNAIKVMESNKDHENMYSFVSLCETKL